MLSDISLGTTTQHDLLTTTSKTLASSRSGSSSLSSLASGSGLALASRFIEVEGGSGIIPLAWRISVRCRGNVGGQLVYHKGGIPRDRYLKVNVANGSWVHFSIRIVWLTRGISSPNLIITNLSQKPK